MRTRARPRRTAASREFDGRRGCGFTRIFDLFCACLRLCGGAGDALSSASLFEEVLLLWRRMSARRIIL